LNTRQFLKHRNLHALTKLGEASAAESDALPLSYSQVYVPCSF